MGLDLLQVLSIALVFTFFLIRQLCKLKMIVHQRIDFLQLIELIVQIDKKI
jgi:hypothetical protein